MLTKLKGGGLQRFLDERLAKLFITAALILYPATGFSAKSICSNLTKRISSRAWIEAQMARVAKILEANPSLALTYSNIQKFGYPRATTNPEVLQNHSPFYSHELPVRFIENQENSGRCWIFSCNRVVELDTGDRIKLSAVYPYFWHLFLQADRYLVDVVKLRPDAETGEFDHYPAPAVEDGGLDEQYFSIARFVGMVPEYAMPENASSLKTNDVTRQLNNYLARIANSLLNTRTQMIVDGAKPHEIAKTLRTLREKGMRHIFQAILVKNLGMPPDKFQFRRRVEVAKNGRLKRARYEILELTPMVFMRKVLKVNPDDWIILGRHPNRPVGKVYQEIESEDYPTRFRDREGIRPAQILNLKIEDLLNTIEASIRAGIPVRFSADVDNDIDSASGIMHPRIHRNFTDLPPSEAFGDIDVKEAMKFGVGDANHAMMLSGYDKPNARSKTIKYKVANSWGVDVGDNGFYHMYREWAEEHLFSIIVPKHVLPAKIRAMLRRKPIILDEPFWERDPREEDEDFEIED